MVLLASFTSPHITQRVTAYEISNVLWKAHDLMLHSIHHFPKHPFSLHQLRRRLRYRKLPSPAGADSRQGLNSFSLRMVAPPNYSPSSPHVAFVPWSAVKKCVCEREHKDQPSRVSVNSFRAVLQLCGLCRSENLSFT